MQGKSIRKRGVAASADKRAPAARHSRQAIMQYTEAARPIHTVYGGAHLYSAATISKVNTLARETFLTWLPSADALAECFGIGEKEVAREVYQRVTHKLRAGAVADYRIDFEDGYGIRSGAEEDYHASAAALAFAQQPPECLAGIRIRPLNGSTHSRAVRTLHLFLTELLGRYIPTPGNPLIITLPKVEHWREADELARLLNKYERQAGLEAYSLIMECMAEVPSNFLSGTTEASLNAIYDACRGRCFAVHFGAYDYLSALGVAAYSQNLRHPWCMAARRELAHFAAECNTRVTDGATTVLPVAPNKTAEGKPLTKKQVAENRAVIWHAWREHFANVTTAMEQGIFQGWDLHPAQIPARYAAVYSYFLNALPAEEKRLKGFLEAKARANRAGSSFDDAATARGSVAFFAQGFACGVFGASEAERTGVKEELLRGGNFEKIAAGA